MEMAIAEREEMLLDVVDDGFVSLLKKDGAEKTGFCFRRYRSWNM